MDSRITRLQRKHAAVEVELAQEIARPAPDLIKVARMKRRKLWLKDLMFHRPAVMADR